MISIHVEKFVEVEKAAEEFDESGFAGARVLFLLGEEGFG